MSLSQRAERVLPGGVGSSATGFASVGGEPLFIRAAAGAYLFGEDGRRYVDYLCGGGSMILGHGDSAVQNALFKALKDGTSFSAPIGVEVELAEQIVAAFPAVDMVRFVSSASEACASALRLARAVTGRPAFVQFEGADHGPADAFLAAASPTLPGIGAATPPGVPSAAAELGFITPYNDVAAVEKIFAEQAGVIAAVIVEPIATHMGVVLPEQGFLERLRELCSEHGSLLIFDETVTAFRVGWGGVQTLLDLSPDLTVFGSLLGAGLSLAAYGGRRELMVEMTPRGVVPAVASGTASRLALEAGRAVLHRLAAEGGAAYERMEETAMALEGGIRELATLFGVPVAVHRQGSIWSLFLTNRPVRNLADAQRTHRPAFARLFHALLAEGVYLPPSPFAAAFLSLAHGKGEVGKSLEAFQRAFARLDFSAGTEGDG